MPYVRAKENLHAAHSTQARAKTKLEAALRTHTHACHSGASGWVQQWVIVHSGGVGAAVGGSGGVDAGAGAGAGVGVGARS